LFVSASHALFARVKTNGQFPFNDGHPHHPPGSVRDGWARWTFAIVLACLLTPALRGAEAWQSALSRMPLTECPAQLNRSNCVAILLRSFQSNPVVKALIFMPGATDEFYMFHRAKARLPNAQASVWEAIQALTNQSLIHATFRPPLLLLHTDEDPLDLDVQVLHPGTVAKLQQQRTVPHLEANDRDWDYLQPLLQKHLKISLRPWRHSLDSWHFYRHSFVAWGLNGWEALETAALAGKTKFTVTRNRATFDVDPRILAVPPGEIPDLKLDVRRPSAPAGSR